MALATYSLSEDYWQTFEFEPEDIEFIYNHLLEIETPLTPAELVAALIKDRLRREKDALERRRSAGGDIYLPKERYEVGQRLVFPALNWRQGEVVGIRPGNNPDLVDFDVINVAFSDEDVREFAARLPAHRLNEPPQVDEDDTLLNPQAVMDEHGEELAARLVEELKANPEFIYIAGRWFPRALLVDVNEGHLNLAEAVLDVAGGGPLETRALLEQVELPTDVNPKLVEFSLDLALQEDPRFDEVGPAGQVLWFLKRLEPPEVQNTPLFLRYSPIDYDRSVLSEEMLALERELDDEFSPVALEPLEEVEVRLIYPHWRVGGLPLSSRMRNLFPTAYEAPRIRFILVDGDSGRRFPGWVVPQARYVFGLKEWYAENQMIPGSILSVRRGENPGEVIVQAPNRRATREWVRTVLVGADHNVVLAMLKQEVVRNFDERMAIVVPDVEALDAVWERLTKERTPFEKIVVDIFRELAKLNPQSHVHAAELYAGVNLVRRAPPGPVLALLNSRSWFVHLGDFYHRLQDFEADS